LLLGSGELGKEFVIACQRLGQYVIAVDSYENAPAMQVSQDFEVIDMLNGNLLDALVAKHQPDIIVPEIEAIRTERFFDYEKQGIKVVLNTGYNRATATGLLSKLNWIEGEDIDLLVTASDVSNNRPAPDMIDYAIKHFAIADPTTVIKVGDSAIDIEEGKNAGCGKTFGVTTGAQTREQIQVAEPTAVVDDLLEILDKIELVA
jgi:phosphonatase-like hydrolase